MVVCDALLVVKRPQENRAVGAVRYRSRSGPPRAVSPVLGVTARFAEGPCACHAGDHRHSPHPFVQGLGPAPGASLGAGMPRLNGTAARSGYRQL
jgi:hypothetical protein